MHNRTKHFATDETNLSQAHTLALESLMSGATTVDAARAAGVDRSTLYRWRRDHDAFRAAFAGARNDLREELSTRLLVLGTKAVEVASGALDLGDVRVALAILRVALPGTNEAECDDVAELRIKRLDRERERALSGAF